MTKPVSIKMMAKIRSIGSFPKVVDDGHQVVIDVQDKVNQWHVLTSFLIFLFPLDTG